MRKHLLSIAAAAVMALAATGPAFAAGASGTTLAASKTLEICQVNDTTWRYYGDISVWNAGAVITSGLQIYDYVQYKDGANWVQIPQAEGYVDTGGAEIPPGGRRPRFRTASTLLPRAVTQYATPPT